MYSLLGHRHAYSSSVECPERRRRGKTESARYKLQESSSQVSPKRKKKGHQETISNKIPKTLTFAILLVKMLDLGGWKEAKTKTRRLPHGSHSSAIQRSGARAVGCGRTRCCNANSARRGRIDSRWRNMYNMLMYMSQPWVSSPLHMATLWAAVRTAQISTAAMSEKRGCGWALVLLVPDTTRSGALRADCGNTKHSNARTVRRGPIVCRPP